MLGVVIVALIVLGAAFFAGHQHEVFWGLVVAPFIAFFGYQGIAQMTHDTPTFLARQLCAAEKPVGSGGDLFGDQRDAYSRCLLAGIRTPRRRSSDVVSDWAGVDGSRPLERD
jgi:hypothetical protein